MKEYWQYIIPGVFALAIAIIEALAAKDRKRAKAASEKQEKRAAQRAEESRLSMQMMDATLQLSIVCANALAGGHNNGNVERAKAAAEKAQADYEKFVQKLASNELAKQ